VFLFSISLNLWICGKTCVDVNEVGVTFVVMAHVIYCYTMLHRQFHARQFTMKDTINKNSNTCHIGHYHKRPPIFGKLTSHLATSIIISNPFTRDRFWLSLPLTFEPQLGLSLLTSCTHNPETSLDMSRRTP